MTTLRNCVRHDRRSVAALEFALVTPLLLTFFGGVVDLGLAVWAKSCLANAVAQGAEYAYRTQQTGTNVTQTQIRNFVLNVSSLSSANISVTDTTVPGYFCMNITTTPPTLSASAQGSNCANPPYDGGKAGLYVKVSATYTYGSIMPLFHYLSSTQITEFTWVRLT